MHSEHASLKSCKITVPPAPEVINQGGRDDFKRIFFLISGIKFFFCPFQVVVGNGCLNYTAYTLKYGGPFDCEPVPYVTGGCLAAALLVVVVGFALKRRRQLMMNLVPGRRSRGIVVVRMPWSYPAMPKARHFLQCYTFCAIVKMPRRKAKGSKFANFMRSYRQNYCCFQWEKSRSKQLSLVG